MDDSTKRINRVEDLIVYRKAFEASMKIFHLSRSFPREERYSLTDQILRSSRSVCANLAEAWRKRRYKAAFVHKIWECSQEAAETQTWLSFALRCEYINRENYEQLNDEYEQIFAILITMERKAESFCR
jgi:four helix bundle protein